MALKSSLTLDAMIKRADFFQLNDNDRADSGLGAKTLSSINFDSLKSDSNFVLSLRKPDFQRETNQWSVDQTLGFIQSFVEGYFVPSVILWQSIDGYVFVIDGAHRLSALRAWIEDDYGDGSISRSFFAGELPTPQMKIAKKIREKVETTIGTYKSLKDKLTARAQNPSIQYDDLINKRLKHFGSRELELQWVGGDANVAEASFFKINTQGTALDKTEESLLRNREKAIAIAARSIIRAATGHKYWSKFDHLNAIEIEKLSKEIYQLYFRPELETPVKTLQLPLSGTASTLDSLAIIIRLLSITEATDKKVRITLKDSLADKNGTSTVAVLKNCLKVLNRITGNNDSSLGLHHAVYFYSERGRPIPEFFLGMAFLIKMKLLDNDSAFFKKFTKVRPELENYLIQNKQIFTQALVAIRSDKRTERVSDVFTYLITDLSQGIAPTMEGFAKAANLKGTILQFQEKVQGKHFTDDGKSTIFLIPALKTAMKCPICGGYIEPSISGSYDHIVRKSEGGTGDHENGQLVHPYCNTGYKS